MPGAGHRGPAPRRSILIEVHDCFSITELVTMEDLFLSAEGEAVKRLRSMASTMPTASCRARSMAD